MIATDWVIIALIVFIAVYDIIRWRRRNNSTISHRVNLLSKRYPWVAIAILIFFVLLFGHFFLPDGYYWPWPQPVFVTE